MSEAIAEAFRQIRDEPVTFIKRLQDAVEGVCGGVAISEEQAFEILLWTLCKAVPDDADRMHLKHYLKRGVMQ